MVATMLKVRESAGFHHARPAVLALSVQLGSHVCSRISGRQSTRGRGQPRAARDVRFARNCGYLKDLIIGLCTGLLDLSGPFQILI